MTILTASLADVQIGTLTIEGLMFEDGSFGVAIPQVADLCFPERLGDQILITKDHLGKKIQATVKIKTYKNDVVQTFKRLYGEAFKTCGVKTELNRNKTLALTLLDFEVLLAKLDRSGCEGAQEFRDSLVGLALHQLFCDAFDLKCDSADRQAYLKARQEGKVTRREWAKSVDDYIYRHNNDGFCTYNYRKFVYSNSTNYLYRKVLGHSARNAKILFQIEQTDSLRDQLSERVLKELDHIENLAMRYVDDDDLEPLKAMKLACEVGKVKYIGLAD